ncbi:hypothetical protein FRX31_006150 [Thalictrum thalictroides]|uniref:Uncharacterized protein n=1 Tax=Thalictrum thalictroides TaxID=46969 RepID=A0A7J6X4E4_THATH|nr:hypothetical protein FRX31_006150 [Thalictrum thalictroides]
MPLPNGIEYMNKVKQAKHFSIKIEKLNFFCFSCGKLGDEKKSCSERFRFNLRENNLARRRYSTALKGLPPESRLHNFIWFVQNQFTENDDPETYGNDPMNPMQVDDLPVVNLMANLTDDALPPRKDSNSNSTMKDKLLQMGPTLDMQH